MYADKAHETNGTHSIRSEAVPNHDPQWNYNSAGSILPRGRFIMCLLGGLRKAPLKSVNLEKLQEVAQDKQENHLNF